ncbi:hypothetical protein FNV43_RR00393 [Rhamnella rubrinervis]|uniref:Uncharacterized protein n=1 Tax=Rhamnella rubrinervis TaxID=2594499 RepID=A0A8K0MR46_9ROSA|nr:hypothetical protein FNV43_RR00393 [Rhamnella rubrinervis]
MDVPRLGAYHLQSLNGTDMPELELDSSAPLLSLKLKGWDDGFYLSINYRMEFRARSTLYYEVESRSIRVMLPGQFDSRFGITILSVERSDKGSRPKANCPPRLKAVRSPNEGDPKRR